MIGLLFEKAIVEAVEFTADPIGKTVDTVTQPIRDGLSVIDGLSEGEIRSKAAARLGADVVSGLALSEVTELLVESLEAGN
jgi:hypothetical protein